MDVPREVDGFRVTANGNYAFESSIPGSITLPDALSNIGEDAFLDYGKLTLTVTEGSFAERYAKEHDIPYVFTTE